MPLYTPSSICRRARVQKSAALYSGSYVWNPDPIITIKILSKPEIRPPPAWQRTALPYPSPPPPMLRTWSGVLPKELIPLGSAPASRSFRTSSRFPRAAALHSRSPKPSPRGDPSIAPGGPTRTATLAFKSPLPGSSPAAPTQLLLPEGSGRPLAPPGQAAPSPWARPRVGPCAHLGRGRALQPPPVSGSKRGGEPCAGGCGKISAPSLGGSWGRQRTARCRQRAPQAENRGQLSTPAGDRDFTTPESAESVLRALLPSGDAVGEGERRGWVCGPAPPVPPHTGEVGC